MPVIKSAKKKLRVSVRKKTFNFRTKEALKTAVKNFSSGPTKETLREAYSALDSAAKKGVIPKGRADRKKGRLALLLSKTSNAKRGESQTTTSKHRTKTSKSPSQK